MTARTPGGEPLFELDVDDGTWSDWRVYLALPPGSHELTARSNTGLAGRIDVELTGREAEPPSFELLLR